MKKIILLIALGVSIFIPKTSMAGVTIINSFNFDNSTESAIVGNYLYVVSWNLIHAVDISDPYNAKEVFSSDFGAGQNSLHTISVQGNYAYVGYNDGIMILDTSNPANPSYINTISTESVSHSIIEGDFLYVFSGGFLKVYNLTNPTMPILEWTSQQVFGLEDMVVNNRYVYALATHLEILDTAQKTQKTIDLQHRNNAGAVLNDLLYIGDTFYHNTYIYNISTPLSPVLIGIYINNFQFSNYNSIFVLDNLLLMGGSRQALEIADITVPENPVFSETAVLPDDVNHITGLDRYAYISDASGLKILDLEGEILNEPPLANAGRDLGARANETIILDGSGSYDNDGEILLYTWRRLPDNKVLCSSAEPTCETTTLGRAEEVIELEVKDNRTDIDKDTMSIFYSKFPRPIPWPAE